MAAAHLWDLPIIQPADTDALDDLRADGVTPDDDLLLVIAYRGLAEEISGDDSLKVDLVEVKEEAGYTPPPVHRIDLFPHATSDAPELDWLDLMHGEFWHELAHALYSQPLCARTPIRTGKEGAAENLLEDIRIERRLIAEHPPTRSWLRANVAGPLVCGGDRA